MYASHPDDCEPRVPGVVFHPLFALPEVDKLDSEKGFLLGTTNQLFLNFPKIKADLVVDLDKFTIFTMTEIR